MKGLPSRSPSELPSYPPHKWDPLRPGKPPTHTICGKAAQYSLLGLAGGLPHCACDACCPAPCQESCMVHPSACHLLRVRCSTEPFQAASPLRCFQARCVATCSKNCPPPRGDTVENRKCNEHAPSQTTIPSRLSVISLSAGGEVGPPVAQPANRLARPVLCLLRGQGQMPAARDVRVPAILIKVF